MNKRTQRRGFIALISVIIISVTLLVTVLSLTQYGIAHRFLLLDLERKSESAMLAEACIHVARIAVVNDPSYKVTNRTVIVDSESCEIISIVDNGDNSAIRVTAASDGATTNLQVVVNSDPTDPDFGTFTNFTEFDNF